MAVPYFSVFKVKQAQWRYQEVSQFHCQVLFMSAQTTSIVSTVQPSKRIFAY